MKIPVVFQKLDSLRVFTDGAIRPDLGASGLAAVVQDANGRIRYLFASLAGRLTCNEAEYAAVIMALEKLRSLRVSRLDVFSDSQVVVHQMCGLATARAPALRSAQAQLRALLPHFGQVDFHHIPRERNRLADALANEAVEGRLVSYG